LGVCCWTSAQVQVRLRAWMVGLRVRLRAVAVVTNRGLAYGWPTILLEFSLLPLP
jgi:hypothetical protein